MPLLSVGGVVGGLGCVGKEWLEKCGSSADGLCQLIRAAFLLGSQEKDALSYRW